MKTPPIHPFAEAAPPMTAEEFAGLKANIKSRHEAGLPTLVNKIVLLDGKILDGRHRQRAHDELGLKPDYADYDATLGDPLDWVVTQAIHRNPTQSQRAAMAVQVCDLKAPASKSRRAAGLKQNRRSGTGSGTDGEKGEARDLAGEFLGVSGRYVDAARRVKESDGKLFAELLAGTKKVSVALRDIHRATKRAVHKKKAADLPKTVNPGDHYTLHVGECLTVMPTRPRRSVRLVVADPPYNEGLDYGEGKRADLLPREQYMKWTGTWMIEASELLTADGALWVIINDEWAAEVAMIAREVGLHRRAWVKWYETFGVNCLNNFNRTSRHLFYFVKDPARFVFNADAVNRPSARQEKYGDKRAHPGGKIWDDVWGVHPLIPRIVGTSVERLPDFKTQLPEELIRPIVGACSDPGDVVVDPFNGSGTTGAVCVRLGRRYEGIDKNAARVKQSDQRLRGVLAERMAEWSAMRAKSKAGWARRQS